MIKNERQYRITKAQTAKFEHAIKKLAASGASTKVHPLLQKAEMDGLRSQLADLRAEIKEYETLRGKKRSTLELSSLDDIPRALIQARIAAGLSQKDLAARLHLKEQQIQRYEATEYASASLARVSEVARALGIKVRNGTLVSSV